jgi:hypothetical protein
MATRAGTSLDEVARRNGAAYVDETLKPSLASRVRRRSRTLASTGSSSLKVELACVLRMIQWRIEHCREKDLWKEDEIEGGRLKEEEGGRRMYYFGAEQCAGVGLKTRMLWRGRG